MRFLVVFYCLTLILVLSRYDILEPSLPELVKQTRPARLTYYHAPENFELPHFLYDVYPAPGSVISLSNYHQYFEPSIVAFYYGIRVELGGSQIDEPLKDPPDNAAARTMLAVEGQLVSEDLLSVLDGLMYAEVYSNDEEAIRQNDTYMGEVAEGPFYLGWKYPLSVGMHEAHFTVTANTGRIYEYKWQFELVK